MKKITSHKKTTTKKTQAKKPAKRTSVKSTQKKSQAKVRHHVYWPDVPAEQEFWVQDGQILKNLADLPEALKNMSNETFRHHVNKDNNDFANWIYHVIGDRDLAEEIRGHKSKTSIIRVIKSRL